jgi:hypothetical protein
VASLCGTEPVAITLRNNPLFAQAGSLGDAREGTIALSMTRPPAKLIWNADHWLDRAEEALTMAADIRNPECKRVMVELAATYKHLAKLTTYFQAAAATPLPPVSDGRSEI